MNNETSNNSRGAVIGFCLTLLAVLVITAELLAGSSHPIQAATLMPRFYGPSTPTSSYQTVGPYISDQFIDNQPVSDR